MEDLKYMTDKELTQSVVRWHGLIKQNTQNIEELGKLNKEYGGRLVSAIKEVQRRGIPVTITHIGNEESQPKEKSNGS